MTNSLARTNIVGKAVLGTLIPLTPARAQNQAVDDLRGKIFDARMAQQTFASGLKFCSEFDGKHFYFQARDRVLDLEEYQRSLENLAKQQVFNPEKHRPWTERDAAERWDLVQKEAARDQAEASWWRAFPRSKSSSMSLKRRHRDPRRKTDSARLRGGGSGRRVTCRRRPRNITRSAAATGIEP